MFYRPLFDLVQVVILAPHCWPRARLVVLKIVQEDIWGNVYGAHERLSQQIDAIVQSLGAQRLRLLRELFREAGILRVRVAGIVPNRVEKML